MTGTFPRFSGVTITYVSHYPDGSTHPLMFSAGMSVQNNPVGTCQPYVSAIPPTAAQCPTCNPVTDPINPANGAMYVTQKDLGSPAGVLEFKRFYTSTNSNSVDLSTGWRHSYQRSISGRYAGTGYAGGYIVAPSNSSLYSDEATACTSGFSQIQGQVIGWSSATASYANGVCTLAIGANVIGTLPILYSSVPTVDITTAPLIGYDAIRDDGQSVSFLLNGTTITQPPSIALQLKQTSGGFTLTDEKDNTEAYDSNGRLLSVSTRGGIVQTANYDSSGRLSTVTDSFGHQLSVAYDSQSRVSSATLQ
jgi:YD repeat-containing protein